MTAPSATALKRLDVSVQQDESRAQTLFEQPLMQLEAICARILETRFADAHEYSERLQIQQHFKNIVTQVSLALAECKGPRRFHYHYRHSDDNDAPLEPADNPPALDILAEACTVALNQCKKKLIGLHDSDLIAYQQQLEHSLRNFLLRYRNFKILAARAP